MHCADCSTGDGWCWCWLALAWALAIRFEFEGWWNVQKQKLRLAGRRESVWCFRGARASGGTKEVRVRRVGRVVVKVRWFRWFRWFGCLDGLNGLDGFRWMACLVGRSSDDGPAAARSLCNLIVLILVQVLRK